MRKSLRALNIVAVILGIGVSFTIIFTFLFKSFPPNQVEINNPIIVAYDDAIKTKDEIVKLALKDTGRGRPLSNSNYYDLNDDYDIKSKIFLGGIKSTMDYVNKSNLETRLTNIKIRIKKIIPLDAPEIKIDQTYTENGLLYIIIKNVGWSDAKEFRCSISDRNGLLQKCFNSEALNYGIQDFESNSKYEIVLDVSKLSIMIKDRIIVNAPCLSFNYLNNQQKNKIITLRDLMITNNNGISYIPDAIIVTGAYKMGNDYGIRISTKYSSCVVNNKDDAIIPPGEIYSENFYFLPDKSCELTFSYELELNGKDIITTADYFVSIKIPTDYIYNKDLELTNITDINYR